MYAAASCSCLVGLLTGDLIAQRVNQKAFANLLLIMLLISMVMLYAEGFAALKGRNDNSL